MIGHVGGYGEAAATGRADRGDGRVDVGRGPRRAHDVGAGFGEGDRGRGSDARARTGDDRDPTVETESIEDHRRNLPGRPPLPSRLMTGVVKGSDGVRRCAWGASTPDYAAYHDDEWGRPVVDDTRLYEKLCLEGFQAGLSWLTILRKRENFRNAFKGFDADEGRAVRRTRHRTAHAGCRASSATAAKIEATIANAKAIRVVQREYGSLAALLWSFEPAGRKAAPREFGEIPASTPESKAASKALLRLGFRFVGPTTVYAAMQSCGIVDDHLSGCAARARCEAERTRYCAARADSIASVTSAASGSTTGEKRATISPSRPMRNFSKFQRMSPVWPSASAVLRQLLVQRVLAVAVHLDLLGERERHVVVGAAEGRDLVGRARLLRAELVAGEPITEKPLSAYFCCKRFESRVLRRQAAERGDVHHRA